MLLRRIEADTLPPGSIREEELDYEVHTQAATREATNKPVPAPAELRASAASMLGYSILLNAMFRSLYLLQLPYWPPVQKRMVESFVLRGLDISPRTAGIDPDLLHYEDDLVAIIKERMTPRNYGSAFCTAVLRKWRSNAVRSVLRARGILQTGVAQREQSREEFEALKRADVAKHGCATAPSPPVPRRRRRSVNSSSAPSVVCRCTAAWNTRRWTGKRTKRRAARRRRRVWPRRRQLQKEAIRRKRTYRSISGWVDSRRCCYTVFIPAPPEIP